ncbi:cell wall hydrolase [Sphingomonas sp.]|uniref:cell wall hydrolase n=1 Tax=Sphingomonas sp. TaxID=28214 RepID=UPI002EDBB31A
MERLSTRRFLAVATGLPALIMATSCVAPQRQYRVSQDVPAPDARALLRRLALDVPTGTSLSGNAGAPVRLGAAPPFAGPQAPDDAARANDCLTAAIYYEARSQGADGERAVAQVVLNRVRDRAFPRSVCGVVYQGSARATGCQFSFTCDGSMDARRDQSAWARARAVAAAALDGYVYAPVGSATHYHADYVLPWWASSLARVTKVGAHVFYRWRGAMENALAFRQQYAGTEPRAGAQVASDEATGVAVHYGNRPDEEEATTGGVAIHRGVAVAPAEAVRAHLVSGVRIHLGVAPDHEDGGEDVTLSDET